MINNIINALVREFNNSTNAKLTHYKGRVAEKFPQNTMLYIPVLDNNEVHNYSSKEVKQRVQIIYFQNRNVYEIDYDTMYDTLKDFKQFLDTHILEVDGRMLNFTYDTRMIDDNVSITINFSYIVNKINKKDIIDNSLPVPTGIYLNGSEIK